MHKKFLNLYKILLHIYIIYTHNAGLQIRRKLAKRVMKTLRFHSTGLACLLTDSLFLWDTGDQENCAAY